jgi:hypothetical protein
MTPDVGEPDADHGSETKLRDASTVEEAKKKMTTEEIAQMPLESLLYYVLVGDGRRTV